MTEKKIIEIDLTEQMKPLSIKNEQYIKNKIKAKERILKALEEKPLTFSQILKKSKTGSIMGQFALSSLEREKKVVIINKTGKNLKWQKVKEM